jgi:Putative zinc-finger
MSCWRIDIRRLFVPYLNDQLGPNAVRRIEDHLLDCGSCRMRFAHMRNGHRLAQEMPRFTPRRDSWIAIEASIAAEQPAVNGWPVFAGWRKVLLTRGFAFAVLGVSALVASMFVANGRRATEEHPGSLVAATALDLGEFHTVNIADIEQNNNAHVVAEGYVSEVRINDEDGDLSFKLVDDLGRPGPFIVCEIIDPIKLAPPPVGSRVRVYGVSRYDGQADHNWYEVHPVLNIEVVRK